MHDADAAGTLIYQSLQEATRARSGRKVQVVNLGLEPEEALAMDLEVEEVDPGERRRPWRPTCRMKPGTGCGATGSS